MYVFVVSVGCRALVHSYTEVVSSTTACFRHMKHAVVQIGYTGPEEANKKWYGKAALPHKVWKNFAIYGVQEALTLFFMIS